MLKSYLEKPVKGFSDQRPAHGALREWEFTRPIPGDAPLELPQQPRNHKQQQSR